MKDFVSKNHKGLFALLVLLVPGSDSAVSALNANIDWSAIIGAVGSADPKTWALAGALAIYPYINSKMADKARAEDKKAVEKLIADLRAQYSEQKKDV